MMETQIASVEAERPLGTTQVMVAYCFADGGIGLSAQTPPGAAELVRGPENLLRERLDIVARHTHGLGLLKVPGVPEGKDALSKQIALTEWINWCARCERHFEGDRLTWNMAAKVLS